MLYRCNGTTKIVAIVVASPTTMDKEEAAERKILRYSLNSCNECRERLRGICIANLDEIALDNKKCQSYLTNKYLTSTIPMQWYVHQFVSTNMPICSMHYKGLLEMEESEPSPRDLRRSTAQTLALELLSISLQCPDPRWEAILPSDSTFAYIFTEN